MQALCSPFASASRLFAVLAALLFVAPERAALQLTARGGQTIALRSHRVDALVEDGLARTTVRQTFVNDGTRRLEAVYRFPVPADAALVDVAMEVGGQRLEGLLAERKRARAVYDEIVRGQRDPALVEKTGDSAYRLSVFPVDPGIETVVELTWIQRVPLENGSYDYVLPLGNAAGAEAHHLALSVTLRASVPLSDPTTNAEDVYVVQRAPGEVHFSQETSRSRLTGDVVCSARVSVDEPDLAVRTFSDGTGGGWFLALLTPPRAREEELLPRDLVLVVDTSGSMERNGKLEQAQAAARDLVDGLRPQDRVNVIRFSSDVEAFAAAPVSLDDEAQTRLCAFLEEFEAKGSTAIGDALAAALATPSSEGRVQPVVFLTDGRPTLGETDNAKLIEAVANGRPDGLRLFTFGVGDDLDGALLRGLATAGGGAAEVFRPGAEIRPRIHAFLSRTAAPVIDDVRLEVDGVRVRDVLPRRAPVGYLGGQIAFVGRYDEGGDATVRVAGNVLGERRVLQRTVAFAGASGPAAGVEAARQLFALEKLRDLEQALRLRSGLDDAAYYAALDRGAHATKGELVEELIGLSIEHTVQCAYTSFLVLLPEDRARLDPHDLEGLTAALERADAARGGGEDPQRGEPILKDSAPEPFEEPVEAAHGDPDFLSDSPFDSDTLNDVIGIGGGAGGKFGGRLGGRRNLRALGMAWGGKPIEDGLAWLARNQANDGSWDGDVDATSLALLALLGDGHTTQQGLYRQVTARGIRWLRDRMDREAGTFVDATTDEGLGVNARATQAVVEAYYFSKSPALKGTAQRAVLALERMGFFTKPPTVEAARTGGWIVFALASARDAGLQVDPLLTELALAWFERLSERLAASDELGARASEARGLCVVARIFLGQDPKEVPILQALGDRLRDAASDPAERLDLAAWFHGSAAQHQLPCWSRWKAWTEALRANVLAGQRSDGALAGSWDPEAAGSSVERVRATARACLAFQTPYRHGRVLGAR